jgi:hypothetical protein
MLLYQFRERWRTQQNLNQAYQADRATTQGNSILPLAIAEIEIDVVETDHDLEPGVAEKLGQSVFKSYVELEAVKEKIKVAQGSITRIRDSIKELSSELMGKTVTVEAFDNDSYAVRLMAAPWRHSIRSSFQSAWLKPATGKLVPPSVQESYGFDGEFILEPTNLFDWIRGAYYINPVGENGEQQVSLTVVK